MSKPPLDRAQELAYRRRRLQAQCAIQRRDLGSAAAHVEFQLSGVDRAVSVVRRVASAPALVSAAVALLTLVGPKRALKWVSQGAFWYTTGKRMLGLVNSQPALSQTLQGLIAIVQPKISGKVSRQSSVGTSQPKIAASHE